MKCLNCDTEMTNNEVVTKKSRISFDMCEKCGSLWLDAGELDKILFQVQGSIEYCETEEDREPKKRVKESGKELKKCPRCDDSVLDKVKFLESDDIFLHLCRNCGGFWLDGGELNLIEVVAVKGEDSSSFIRLCEIESKDGWVRALNVV